MHPGNNNLIHPIYLDYPVYSEPRYGWGKPPHPRIHEILNRGRKTYSKWLHSFLQFLDQYRSISRHANRQNPNRPYWINNTLPGLDAVAIYGFIGAIKPKQYFEIGNGNSTRFARQSISDLELETRITAIDPFPPRRN